MTQSSKLEQLQYEVSLKMIELEKLFTKDMKLTFIARHPTIKERCVVFTLDDLDAVIETIEHMRDRPTTILRSGPIV